MITWEGALAWIGSWFKYNKPQTADFEAVQKMHQALDALMKTRIDNLMEEFAKERASWTLERDGWAREREGWKKEREEWKKEREDMREEMEEIRAAEVKCREEMGELRGEVRSVKRQLREIDALRKIRESPEYQANTIEQERRLILKKDDGEDIQ